MRPRLGRRGLGERGAQEWQPRRGPIVPRFVAFLLVAAAASAQTGCTAPSAGPPVEPSAELLEAVDWYTGVAGRVDDGRARELLERALGRGAAGSERATRSGEAAGPGEPVSPEEAVAGNAIAAMWWARVHSRGRMGFPHDEEAARNVARAVIGTVEASAEAGVLEAVFLMGTAYDEGLGKPVDPAQAAVWHRRAAERGHVLGAHNLGNAYSEGRGVPQDPALAVEWWTQAAEHGDAITQLRLGEAYEAGRGVARDVEVAVAWYRQAAERGNAQAEEALRRLEG